MRIVLYGTLPLIGKGTKVNSYLKYMVKEQHDLFRCCSIENKVIWVWNDMRVSKIATG